MSALGAMRALRDKGLRIPEDVALVGFDDIRDSRAVSPPLTTVRHPTFAMGYGAVTLLLDRLARRSGTPELVRVPARLIIRRSCGCGPDATVSSAGTSDVPEGLAAHVAAEVARESRHAPPDLLVAQCSRLVDAFTEGVKLNNAAPFLAAMREALRRCEELDDDPHAWQAGISLLRGAALPGITEHERRHAELMVDHARVMVAERTRRQATRALVRQEMVTDQIGQMTAELLTTLDEAQIGFVLEAHLPAMGVQHLLAVRYRGDEDEADTRSEPILACGLAAPGPFLTRQFPPAAPLPQRRTIPPCLAPPGRGGFHGLSRSGRRQSRAAGGHSP
ncbi:substrate-binding domain-containing protein [Candidatus Gracilibacteria bacterium]|nr:substrate-binding domain-containing protein [Candidatus Gracilibacteria bacterium]